jgi:hypothetical protein
MRTAPAWLVQAQLVVVLAAVADEVAMKTFPAASEPDGRLRAFEVENAVVCIDARGAGGGVYRTAAPSNPTRDAA